MLYSAAQVVGRIMAFAALIVAGNVLGPARFGVFGNATTYLVVIAIVSTFGLDLWISRHVANSQLNRSSFIRIVAWRFSLSCMVVILMVVAIWGGLLGSLIRTEPLPCALIVSSIFFDHISTTAIAILEGRRRLTACSWLTLVRWISFSLLTLLLLWANPEFMSLAAAWLVSSGLRALVSWFLVRGELNTAPADFSIRNTLIQAAPLAVLNFMIVLYFHIDMVMLPEMAPAEHSGWYKMAYTLIESLLFLSAAVAAALYPLFSNRQTSLDIKAQRLSQALRLLAVIAMPIAWGTSLVSEPLIAMLFQSAEGDFGPSSNALNILVWALPFMFANSSLVRLFLGLERQKLALSMVSVTALINLVLNAWSIPHWGYVGAASATVFSEAFLTVAMSIAVRRWSHHYQPLKATAPVFVCAASVQVAGMIPMHPVVVVVLAACVYGSLVLLFKLVSRSDLTQFAREDIHD